VRLALAALVFLSACANNPVDPGMRGNDGGARDAGRTDAGSLVVVDAGPPFDAGPTAGDAGCVTDVVRPCTTSCGSTGSQTCLSGAFGACIPPAEACGDGRDDDCDGVTDESEACTPGSTEACVTSCGSVGTRRCEGCGWGACEPPPEECGDGDDDCDGATDEGFPCAVGAVSGCTTSCGSVGQQICTASCTLGTCSPPEETCNGDDDDCDDRVDENFECSPGEVGDCTTTCGSSSTRSCDSSCGWRSCGIPEEVCNGADDDCDDSTDEGFRVEVLNLSYSGDLQPRHAPCDGVAMRVSRDCNAAIHRACAVRSCANTGFGPVENTGDTARVSCVVGTVVSVSWATLSTRHAGCNASNTYGPDCNAAISRHCAALGGRTGFGPVEAGPTNATVVCTPWAETFRTNYTEMAASHPLCDGTSSRFGTGCNAAIHRWCRGRGFESGFGPLENAGNDLDVACVDP